MMRTGLLLDPIYLKHDTGSHPENAGRLRHLMQEVEKNAEINALERVPVRRAETREIALVHQTSYQRQVEAACASGSRFMGSMDCIISPETYEVALHATGGVLQAVSMVAEDKLDNAFCAIRPPGHHAETAQAMGFCYFNNIAIAAEFLLKEYGYQRVLIFDFDVHHGNGTQHTFEERKDVFFCSVHQDPTTCYPGTGYASETGHGDGKGYTLNIPMEPFSTDEDYSEKINQQILPAFHAFQPDFVLISAGFDAHKDDPLAHVNLTTSGFDHLIGETLKIAKQYSNGKLVSILEGGYNHGALSECILSHLTHLMRGDA